MKRFQVVGVTLAVMLALGVLTASAVAQTFLLAEWLVGGVAVTTELLVEIPEEILFTDTALSAMILCSVILDGWIGPNSLDFITEVLSLSGGPISQTVLGGTAWILCVAQEGCSTTAGTPNLWFVNLPWETEIELMEDGGSTFFADLILPHAGGGNPGWTVECTILGVESEDECKFAEGIAELKLEGSTLLAIYSEAFTELAGAKLATCSFAGGETGIVEGEGVYGLSGGGEPTASSEGVIS